MVVGAGTKRVVGYCRVSTEQQAGERHVSLETQRARILSFCEARGHAHVETFTDVFSGRRDDRPEYRRVLAMAERDELDIIAIQFLDRFGRNPREILRRIWALQERGVEVVCTDEDIKEELVLLMRAGLAGAESKRNSERVRGTMRNAAMRGSKIGKAPYGYRRVRQGDEVVWEQEPRQAVAVREMYRLAVEENLGYKAMAEWLQAHGYPTRAGRPWASFTLQLILRNEALVGTMVYGRVSKTGDAPEEPVRIQGYYPAILSDGEWAQLQERLSIRREHSRGGVHQSVYLLSGVVRCGHCGGPMVGVTAKKRGRIYPAYYCSQRTKSSALCDFYNHHMAHRLEAAILEHLGQYSDPDRVRALVEASLPEETNALEEQIRAVVKQLTEMDEDLVRNLGLLKRGLLDERDFSVANAARRDERTAAENRRADLERRRREQQARSELAEAVPVKVRSFLEDFSALEIRKAKALLQGILKAAYVYRDGRVELEFRS